MQTTEAKKWPVISVITPVRNAADTLRETIESILTQEYPALEYIVVDGGSTDGSLEIVYEYARHIDTLLHGRDRNLYDGVAKGFAAARGDVLAWLNADDIYEPGILRRVGCVFADHPEWDVVYFDGTVWKQGWRTPNRNQKPVALPELMRGHILYQDSVFFRRRAYEAVGGLDRVRYKLAGDYDLWLRLAERFAFHYLPETASCFRIRSGQLSGDWNAYTREMDLARVQAGIRQQEKAPRSPGRSLFAVRYRRWLGRRIDARKRFVYPLRDENQRWPDVTSQPLPPLSTCRCGICGQQPDRLLFSTPDTWFGDRRIWHIYYCTHCSASAVFPPPSDKFYGELHERSMKPYVGASPEDRYKLFATSRLLEGNDLYTRAAAHFPRFARHADDIPRVHGRRDAPIAAIGSDRGRMVESLVNSGWTHVMGLEANASWCRILHERGLPVQHGELFSTPPPAGGVVSVALNGTLEQFHDPVTALNLLRGWLRRHGRIYISTPNLDSIWLERYGPCWSRWHAPVHRHLFTPEALRRLAARAGYKVVSLRTCTPPMWVVHSDLLAGGGLGMHLPPPRWDEVDSLRRQQAEGASVLAALRWDWRLRGDCIHAVLMPSH